MSDFQSVETSGLVPTQEEVAIPLDNVKSIFYLLKGKPDTELRLLPDGKVLDLADITNINQQVQAKLSNHNVTAEVTSINFILSRKKIKEFSAWEEFERETWDNVNEKIESLTISWDILLQLPQYQIPQRHSMKLRIGEAIPPKDLFQLLFTSDNIIELMEAGAAGVCKVDFINNIIAIELLNIVKNWHEGLKNSPESSLLQKILKRHGKSLSEIIRYSFPILLVITMWLYSPYFFPILQIKDELSIDSLQKLFIFWSAIFMTGLFLGKRIEKSIDREIDKIEEYPRFSITRGDHNSIDEFEKNNNKLKNKIASKFFWTIFSFIITYILKFIIQLITSDLP